jgi:NAD(P)-dependent dehydrogenase (short-subunit alcohol dehydrogenase family)
MSLPDRAVVAITGGARGIGLATAEKLARHGARVWIGDLDGELAEREAAALGVQAAQLDVGDRASFAAFLDSARSQDGPLDALVNNAGVMPFGPFLDEPDATSELALTVNLRGVILGMKLALGEMVDRGRGHVVNVASLAARLPVPGAAVYSGTKAAVVGMSDAVRRELAGTGVALTCVLPGMVRTELSSGAPEGRGISAVEPEAVADGIVRALDGRGGTVVVPRLLDPVSRGAPLLPGQLERLVRRTMGDDRILTRLDHDARAAYAERLGRQSATTRSKNWRST